MGNWVQKIWKDAADSNAMVLGREGKLVRLGDEIRKFRADMYARHARAVQDWSRGAVNHGPMGRMSRTDDQQALYSATLATQTLAFFEKHEYEPAKWANGGLIPITSEVDEGANVYEWQEMRANSEGVYLISNEDDEIPTVSLSGDVNTGRAAGFAKAFSYTSQDLRAGKFNKFNLAAELGAATRESLDRDLNSLIADGHSGVFVGVYNLDAPAEAVNSGEDWTSTADAADIRADLRHAFDRVNVSSNGVETPDTLVLPHGVWLRLMTEPHIESSTVVAPSIMAYLKEAFPMIKRWDWDQGCTDNNCALLYHNNATRIRADVSMPPMPHEVEKNGLRYRTIMESRYAGIILRRPESFLRLTGVVS